MKSSKPHFSKKQKQKKKGFSKPKKRFTNKISDHFSKLDFTCKESGKFKVSLGLVGALEELRTILKKRIDIKKGYEATEVAEKKGSLKRNLHTQGLAADIVVDGLSLSEIFLAAEQVNSITGIGINKKEAHIHIETRKMERRLWLEDGNEEIEITQTNKQDYIETN